MNELDVIRFTCPHCGTRLKFKPKPVATTAPCPNASCGRPITVPAASVDDVQIPAVSTRWYFLAVGDAMGKQVNNVLQGNHEFDLTRTQISLASAKKWVRHYYLPPESRGRLKPDDKVKTFRGLEFPLNPRDPPLEIAELEKAFWELGGNSSSGGERPVITILADDRINETMRRFQDYLNHRYMDMGMIPMARLVCTDDRESAENLCSLFKLLPAVKLPDAGVEPQSETHCSAYVHEPLQSRRRYLTVLFHSFNLIVFLALAFFSVAFFLDNGMPSGDEAIIVALVLAVWGFAQLWFIAVPFRSFQTRLAFVASGATATTISIFHDSPLYAFLGIIFGQFWIVAAAVSLSAARRDKIGTERFPGIVSCVLGAYLVIFGPGIMFTLSLIALNDAPAIAILFPIPVLGHAVLLAMEVRRIRIHNLGDQRIR